ncbi:MAG: isoprenylcysteine carboxylmethyltransferase family protein [Ornithinimicrobium sp.]
MSRAPVPLRRSVPLLSQMANDLTQQASLRAATATAMWAAYTAHTGLTGWTLARRVASLPLPPGFAGVAGAGLMTAGVGACVAGMSRFAGPKELTGSRNQELTTTGIYRYSRNPQYLGYLLALTGAALARRSGAALCATGVLATAYAAWIPVEEHHLTHHYGQPYLDYTRRTRRWWGTNP